MAVPRKQGLHLHLEVEIWMQVFLATIGTCSEPQALDRLAVACLPCTDCVSDCLEDLPTVGRSGHKEQVFSCQTKRTESPVFMLGARPLFARGYYCLGLRVT